MEGHTIVSTSRFKANLETDTIISQKPEESDELVCV